MIRRMTLADVPAVVDIHRRTFPHFFLTFLGPAFLRLLYRSIVDDAGGIAFVSVNEAGRITGFVAGVEKQSGFYRRLARRRAVPFAFAASGAFLRKPAILPRLLRAFYRSSEAGEASAEALLMSIGVDPEIQSRGTGRQLVNAFAGESRRRGIRAFCLTTDADDNDGVNAFYLTTGFALARTFTTAEGRRMNEYLMRLE